MGWTMHGAPAGAALMVSVSLLLAGRIGIDRVAVEAVGQSDAASLKMIPAREKKPHQQTIVVSPPLTSSESSAMLADLRAIRTALLATPALIALHGYDWETNARIDGHEAGRPVKARLGYIAYPYAFNARTGRAESSAEGAPFTIAVNDPDVVLGNGGYLVDEEARFTFAPVSAGTVDRFPAYVSGENFVVITRDGRPLFVPVTQRQFLDVRIAERRKSLDGTRASLASVGDSPAKTALLQSEEQRLHGVEAELAAMTDAQRAQPALDPDGAPTSRASGLADPGSAKSRAIVMVNPAMFDPKKPRAAAQLIVLGSIRYAPELYAQVQKEIDKSALLRLLQ